MRVKHGRLTTLVDLPPVQADRLKNTHFQRAIAQSNFDPFPDGTVCDTAVAKNSGSAQIPLACGPLTSFDGALPDHIQYAMLAGLHDDDPSLRDFLAIFDRRLLELRLRAERASVLVSTQDYHGQQAASILSRLLQVLSRDQDDPRVLKLLAPLLSRTRSLSGLRDILVWATGARVTVHADFSTLRQIDQDSLGRLTCGKNVGAPLGHGAMLGRFGRTPMGHISVLIACENRADLDRMMSDTKQLSELRSLTSQYLRDPAPVTFFATIARECLKAPRLSSRPDRADRLGAYNLLNPARHPNDAARIKLTQISA